MKTGWMVYICVINILAFVMFGYDKQCARRDLWRVPERTLFFLAAAGGSAGAWAGMYVFRHKTRKGMFRVGIPLLLLAQLTASMIRGGVIM